MTSVSHPAMRDPAAQRVMSLLIDAGHQSWFVGGCVRNALLQEPVSDIDIATDARPDRVTELADKAGVRTIPTGIDHGTVTLIVDERPFEVTTFRRDVETDGRRAVVAFSDDITEDALRRDLTINALYADQSGEIADPTGQGLIDLEKRRVRFIGDPQTRIREDYLRILRFFRFHAWYGDPDGGIDADGLAACAALADGLETLPAERNWQEMRKLLAAPDPAPALASMGASGVLHRIVPGSDPAALAVLVHVEDTENLPPNPIRRLAAIGGEPTRLRLSKAEDSRLTTLKGDHDLGELAHQQGAVIAVDWLAVQSAVLQTNIEPNRTEFAKFAARQVFPLQASDLMPALEGKDLGEALKMAKARWIASGFTLTREDLLG